ncbi:hypothetical protein, partial [Rathayibacter sp. AY1E1]|uniref:hypothetical protein n=1 Tax=Rathayibacter sp. AY1E1 TaxID=2080549 RepID=UPI000D42CBC2
MSDPTVISGPAGELPAGPPGQLLMNDETGDFFYLDDTAAPVTPPLRLVSSIDSSAAPGYYLVGTEAYSVETAAAPLSNLDKWRKIKPTIWADGSSELTVIAKSSVNNPDYTIDQIFVSVAAKELGGKVLNRGNGGRIRGDVVLANLTPGSSAYVPGSTPLVTQSAGGNEFPRAWSTEVGKRGFKNSTSALLGIYRHKSKVLPGTDETGSWGQAEYQYSKKTRKSTTPGSTQTIRFTGTGATLMMMGYTDAIASKAFAGSKYTWSLDGGAPVSSSTKSQGICGADKAPVIVQPIHFRDLEDTEHTVVIKHTGSSGDPLIVDSLLVWQKRLQDMPFVLMMPPAKTTSTALLLYPTPRATNAMVEPFRQLQEDVFTEFGRDGTFGGIPGEVIDRWFPPNVYSLRGGDTLHPNREGQYRLGQATLEGLSAYAPTSYLAEPGVPGVPDTGTDPDPDPGTDPDPGSGSTTTSFPMSLSLNAPGTVT